MSSKDVELSSVSDVRAVIPPEPKRNDSNSSPLLIFVLVVGLIVGFVALVIAAISLGRTSGGGGGGSDDRSVPNIIINQDGTGQGDTSVSISGDIWTFAIGHDGTNLEYIDDLTGTLRGFHVDIVDAVCAAANKDCRLIWDVYENCWDSEAGQRSRGGFGLMARWYDACTGWFNTYKRALTVQFSDEFRVGLSGIFYVRPSNPGGFNPTNIPSNQKIGFLDGWASDEYCLARNADAIQGVPLAPSQVRHYPTREAFKAGIIANEVAAGFANTNVHADDPELDTVGQPITNCIKGGGSIMSRLDSSLNVWWNPAFASIKNTETYRQICERASTSHGHTPGATGPDLCLN
ncbi:uncharacterized protein LOC121410514 [Lytechinus variegatus]|uniref:uncharacterized protein LOC121410514 n=1 Tax=Lytechinus variegatus TaxID=7654 RepID=UPI001BB1BADC|nr:uncharacterized protein LOC121410514 [Lytechinus variegatus]